MGELDRIRGFLDVVRRRVLMRDAVRWSAFAAAALLVIVLVLSASAAALGPASFWLPATLGAALVCAAAAALVGVWRPLRLLRADVSAARAMARMDPRLGTLVADVVSAVQLGAAQARVAPKTDAATDNATDDARASAKRDADSNTLTNGDAEASPISSAGAEPDPDTQPDSRQVISPALVRAFQGHVAESLQPLDPARLVSMRPATWGAAALLAALVLLIAGAQLSPDVIGRGLSMLFHRPSRFEGAAISAKPLVGDVRITYEYPPYTGLPPRTVEGSTGDIVAVKGTHVRIETTPLHTSRSAMLLLGEAGEVGEIAARISKGTLTAHLTLLESSSYRFWLQPLIGRAVREQRSHRLEAEADRPPRVEIHGPADRLELPTPRPIEVGYAADDDFGLGLVELVFRVDDAPEQRQLLKDAHGAKLAQGRALWDPARLGLSPGSRIAYHVEARDRDEISGAKVGSSRTLYVAIARPQENIDDRLDRQREVLERLTGNLADRLELPGRPAVRGAPAASADAEARHAAYVAIHEAAEAHVALLGRLLDDDRREGTLGKSLRAALAGIADRLGRLLREEKDALGANRPAPAREGAWAGALAKLDAQRDRHIDELEKDVLQLDSLIGRQRLEDLAAVGRELTDAHRRLQDLLARYASTKDEALRRQLEREVRDLRARISDLAQKIANIKSRNEVPDEWRNLPDAKDLVDQAKKLDDLIAQGDPQAMSRALDQLGKDLRSLRQMLDENADGFGAERFPQENRVVSELMKKIGDLEGDERQLAGETQSLSDKQDAETEKRLRGRMADWTRKENEKVERLRQKLGQIKTGDPESALSEEVERAREGARQVKRLLAERDLAEAKDQADRAVSSLDRASEHLDEEGRKRRKPGPTRGEASDSVAEARALAQEIADDTQQMLPKPEDTLSPEERERARAQADRQGTIGDRTDEIARDAARRLGKLPGLERASDELRDAAEQMRQASGHLRKSEAKQAGGAERNAAERLAKLRDTMQERTMGGGKNQRDPVRIPGADESSAPRAWRQELLDAMKEKAPEHFQDDVRRYYEELVR